MPPQRYKPTTLLLPNGCRRCGNGPTVIAGHIHERWHFTRQAGDKTIWLVGDWQAKHGSWVEILADGTCSHVAFDYANDQQQVLATWPVQNACFARRSLCDII